MPWGPAGEWAQAVSLPRPRLLEALRDDSCVKAALADGAVRQSCRSRAANPVRGEYKLHAAGDPGPGLAELSAGWVTTISGNWSSSVAAIRACSCWRRPRSNKSPASTSKPLSTTALVSSSMMASEQDAQLLQNPDQSDRGGR